MKRQGVAFHVVLAFLGLLVAANQVTASEAIKLKQKEAVLKAAFIFNFIKFTTWPEYKTDDGLIVMGVLDEDRPACRQIYLLNGRTVQGRGLLRVEILTTEMLPLHLQELSLIYLDDASTLSDDMLDLLIRHHVLIISGCRDSLEERAMIALYVDRNRMRFDINRRLAEMAGIHFSSKLLNLAGRVF